MNEQELIDAINQQWEERLDKIVEEVESMDFDFGDYHDHTTEIIEKVCKVIDKYRKETEQCRTKTTTNP